MQRLRIPQSSFSVSGSQLFKGGTRILHNVYKQYDQMLAERATKGLEPPKVPGYAVFNSEDLARWLRDREDDNGLGCLITMSAHWPDAPQLEKLFEALDGMTLGPRTKCALEYVIDCCEVVKEVGAVFQADGQANRSLTDAGAGQGRHAVHPGDRQRGPPGPVEQGLGGVGRGGQGQAAVGAAGPCPRDTRSPSLAGTRTVSPKPS